MKISSVEAREIVTDLSANTLAPSQYPTVTTQWWASQREDGIVTVVPLTYTQTFATTVLEQLGKAQSGRIGLGASATGESNQHFGKESVGEDIDAAIDAAGDVFSRVGRKIGDVGEEVAKAGGQVPKHGPHEHKSQAVREDEGEALMKVMLFFGLLTCVLLLME